MEAAETLPSRLSPEQLLDWRPRHGVVTVCLEIDPADRGDGWRVALRNALGDAVRPADDAHDRGRALEATAQRIIDRFDGDGLPSGRLHLGFCEAAEKRGWDIWMAAQMEGFETEVSYGERPGLTRLVKLLDEGAARGALAVSSERVHLFEWNLGALDLVEDWEIELYERDWRERKAQSPADPARQQGASSSGRDQFAQRLEHNRERFLEEVGRLVADRARDRDWRSVLAFGDPAQVRRVDEGAEKGTSVELAEDADVINEERGKLLGRINSAVADGNRRRELALIEKAVEGARTPGGRGALGLIDVQRSLNEGRVEQLIYDADTRSPGLADAEDEIIERAIRTSAGIVPAEGEAAERLQEHGGVAAVLRY